MKKLKFLFFSLLLAAFLAPNVVNAQADFFSDFRADVWINIDAGNQIKVPASVDARALVTPSGIIHVKAEFQLKSNNPLVPQKGKKKIIVDVVRFRCDMNNTGKWSTNLLYTQYDVQATVSSDGVVKLVTKALVEDGIKDW